MDEYTRRLYDEVARRAEGKPYAVVPTDKGFDVTVDIADAQWFELFGAAGLKKAYTHHVAVDGERVTITDDSREVRWKAGVPRLSASAERTVGRSYQFSAQKTWALDRSGKPGKVVDYTFSSEEGRRLIKGAIAELGLDERMPMSAKAPLVFAIVVLVLTLGGLAVAAILGQLG